MLIQNYIEKTNLRQKSVGVSPKVATFNGKLFELIINGTIDYGKHTIDSYMSLVQYFLQIGYIFPAPYKGKSSELQHFFQSALFSVSIAHIQLCARNNFDIIAWRKQFSLFEEVKLKKLNPFYRSRANMPIPQGFSVKTIEQLLFDLRHEYWCNGFSPYGFTPKEQYIIIDKNSFKYVLELGNTDVEILSEENENYIDFITTIYQHWGTLSSSLIECGYGKYKIKR